MTERVRKMLDTLNAREYRAIRREGLDISGLVKDKELCERETIRFEEMLGAEEPYILEGDIFGFNRTIKVHPQYTLPDGTSSSYWLLGNITPNYYNAIKNGFSYVINEINSRKNPKDTEKYEYYLLLERHINATLKLCERYREKAESQHNIRLANALKKIPYQGAETLYEALLFQKIIIFMLRCAGYTHITLGRFDQYMYGFYLNDIKNGLSDEELFELIELYFISLNFDTDLYQGVQLGDNGQSMVLGGYDVAGKDLFNELSRLCMEASLELDIIDPKINLRVSKKTPIERYEYATRLTKKGLGFPQYCNDDVVVSGLVSLGYDLEDAVNYTVAACWEFIVPNCGMDIPNEATFNMPLVVNNAVHKHLQSSPTFEELLEKIKSEIAAEVNKITSTKRPLRFSPCLSIFLDGCIERGIDISENVVKYNNSGCHCAGISNAADAVAAIKKTVYDEKLITPEALLVALDKNFVGYFELQSRLMSAPKMGNNIEYVDDIACFLTECFSKALNGRHNSRGGIWRAGTGSAQEYINSANECPATADGREAGKPYASSYSPAINTKLNGPLSVIQSFTKFDLSKIINGGPLTMELHDTVFRNVEGEKKVAQLVKLFIDKGGHQLQLNSINRDRLIDAQKNPELHKNLIVRVWGWSGFFCELEKKFQDHIIARAEFEF